MSGSRRGATRPNRRPRCRFNSILPTTESFTRRWRRRAVSVTLVAVAFAALLVLLPVLLVAAAVHDIARRTRGSAARTAVFTVYLLGCELLGVSLAALSWVYWRLAPWVDHARFVAHNYALQRWWCNTLARGGAVIFGLRFDVQLESSGDAAARPGARPLLVFSRHASMLDSVLPMLTLAVDHGLDLRYVLKRELLWDPCLDIVGQRLPNCFVARGGSDTQGAIAAVGELARDIGPGEAVVIFPEGTRFTEGKRRRLIGRLREKGDEIGVRRAESFRSVLPPRPGGALALLEHVGDSRDVMVLAHTGFEGSASLVALLKGALVGRTIHVRMSVTPGADIPEGPGERVAWLDARWHEVDRFVEERGHARA